MRLEAITHEFVEYVPDTLEEGRLYVSIRFATTAHLCCCGCGNEVNLPLTPTDWSLTYDGATVSLCPSVGNWSFPCRSHYWIRHGRVEWAPDWSREKVEAGRARDRARRESYFAGEASSVTPPAGSGATRERPRSRVRQWLSRCKR